MLGKDYATQDCGLARALELIGERWTMLILRDAFFGVERFNDFAEHVGAPRAVLTDRLRTLVDEGLLERLPDPDHRGRSLYRLTEDGRSLWPALHALSTWGAARSGQGPPRTFRHAACGTELQSGGVCPACGVVPPPDEVETERTRRPATQQDPVTAALQGPRRLLTPLERVEPAAA